MSSRTISVPSCSRRIALAAGIFNPVSGADRLRLAVRPCAGRRRRFLQKLSEWKAVPQQGQVGWVLLMATVEVIRAESLYRPLWSM